MWVNLYSKRIKAVTHSEEFIIVIDTQSQQTLNSDDVSWTKLAET